MLPEIEKRILEKIDYADRYLYIREKYMKEGESIWLFKKSDVIQVFEDLKIKANYLSGGLYLLERRYKNYVFEYRFVISKNNFSIYLYMYADNELIQNRISNMGSLLRYLPYDLSLAEKVNSGGFVLDSKDKLKNYIYDILHLLDEFVNQYIVDMDHNEL